MPKLLCFGTGYTAQALIARLTKHDGWQCAGTTRDPLKRENMAAPGLEMQDFENADFAGVTHILVSAPPGEVGDPVLARYGESLGAAGNSLEWVGYLSTTGVYGDHGGAWVDEETPLAPASPAGTRRAAAERAWRDLSERSALPLHIFRLAGIYGPGRNALVSVHEGTARRIVKKDQVFSRIHVADIAQVLEASMVGPAPGAVYNVCDDEPAPAHEVIEFACDLLGLTPPPLEEFEAIKDTLSPMARGFYAASKCCRNTRIKTDLGVRLHYPTYREGLRALLADPER